MGSHGGGCDISRLEMTDALAQLIAIVFGLALLFGLCYLAIVWLAV